MKATIEQRAEQALAGGQTLTQVRKSHAARPLEENLPIRRGRCGAGMASRGRMATPGITDAEVFGQMRGIFQCTRGTPGTAERAAAAHGGNLLRTSLSALPGRWAHPSPTARFRKTATLCGLWPVLAGPESSPRAARRREAAAVAPAPQSPLEGPGWIHNDISPTAIWVSPKALTLSLKELVEFVRLHRPWARTGGNGSRSKSATFWRADDNVGGAAALVSHASGLEFADVSGCAVRDFHLTFRNMNLPTELPVRESGVAGDSALVARARLRGGGPGADARLQAQRRSRSRTCSILRRRTMASRRPASARAYRSS